MSMNDAVPFLTGCYAVADRIPSPAAFPFDLPFVGPEFDVTFDAPIVLFVGENGTGKSTLLESIAALCRLPVGGGGGTEALVPAESSGAVLAGALRPRFRRRPSTGFFLRAETLFTLANTLEERDRDRDFLVARDVRADPFERYGGRTLHARSHGEAFLAVMEHRMASGMFILDEPEAALSPQRQMAFATLVDERVRRGGVQVVMATHSPLLMTMPGARILLFDGETIRPTVAEETPHWQITQAVMANPRAFWRTAREID